MADLESLNYPSITTMAKPEAIELLRSIRLSRRTPVKPTKEKTSMKKQKAINTKKAVKAMNKSDIDELLRLIGDD